MKRILSFPGIATFILLLAVFTSCSKTDINNDEAVMNELQGTWIGNEMTGTMYQHIKLRIYKDTFEGWVQMSDTQAEPEWTELPNEKGLISLSSVQDDPETTVKFRKFAFTCDGRCCGDKSLSLKALSGMISYVEGKGLTLSGKSKLSKKE
ncbi:MAG TPA: hypothetical protein DEH15_19350 [Marinilabiliales bacterium]|nr:hypothetical protein [Marinilabiliales bacterium]